ncbi:MAG TPA: hypothetical protein PLZ68_18615, partial [Ferruginibacter sp.]|nr:hypothetical protein [Ferruginibacter sp.]
PFFLLFGAAAWWLNWLTKAIKVLRSILPFIERIVIANRQMLLLSSANTTHLLSPVNNLPVSQKNK